MSGHLLLIDASVRDRFWSKVFKGAGQDDCWVWVGSGHKDGYGWFRLGGRMHGAHRISWQIEHGWWPGDLYVLHTCDNPMCVRPSHLFLGDQTANMADMVAKGRQGARAAPRGGANGNAKLTTENVLKIRELYAAGGISQERLGRLFGVTATPIGQVIRGVTWSHV